MIVVYNLLLLIFLAVSLPNFAKRGRLSDRLYERLGKLNPAVAGRIKGRKTIWVHAVSVGELRLAIRMLEDIISRQSSLSVLLTVNTPSARQIAEAELTKDCYNIAYFPFDLSWVMRRFIRAVNPSAAIVFETEIWPNMLTQLKRIGCPCFVVNARISDKAFDRYRPVRFLLKPFLRMYSLVLAQSSVYADRFQALGVPKDLVKVTGNMKFDLRAGRANQVAAEIHDSVQGSPVILAASTHADEEMMFGRMLKQLKSENRSLRLWIAPRHLERIGEIECRLKGMGIDCRKFSELEHDPANVPEVILFDVWGILKNIYACADLIVMGGTFADIGGHNLAEPALEGKPVIFGPNIYNFSDMAESLIEQNAAVKADDEAELLVLLRDYIGEPASFEGVGLRAREFVRRSSGATTRNIEEVEKCF